jgi:hypothetical protein
MIRKRWTVTNIEDMTVSYVNYIARRYGVTSAQVLELATKQLVDYLAAKKPLPQDWSDEQPF